MEPTIETEEKKEVATQTKPNRPTLTPHYRIQRKETEFVVTVHLPGVAEDNLELQLKDQWLKLKAEMELEIPEGFRNLHQEFSPSNYALDLKVPGIVDTANINAQLANGILTLTLPKAKEHTPRSIRVNV